VRCATAAAFRTALEQRLLATARGASIPVVRLRKLVAFKRLLVAAPDRWVPKGALAFHVRLAARFRITKDPDLGRWDDERAATDDLAIWSRRSGLSWATTSGSFVCGPPSSTICSQVRRCATTSRHTSPGGGSRSSPSMSASAIR
jgi:hypothetical protein